MVTPETSFARLIRTPSYASLGPYLSESATAKLKQYNGTGKITVALGPADNFVRQIVSSEIHRIEKSWKLI
jgi:hypothetical protein